MSTTELLASLSRLRDNATYRELSSIDEARKQVRQLLGAAPPAWADLPEVQSAVGRLYGEFGQGGFDAARAAYERAIAAEDQKGLVPIKTIEQLANLEARTAEHLCDQRDFSNKEDFTHCVRLEAISLVDRAIGRLVRLIAITSKPDEDRRTINPANVERANLERQSLLGSAHKRKAKLLADRKLAWSTIAKELRKAQSAYRAGEGSPDDTDFDPYAMINRLHLDAILDPEDARQHVAELAGKCQTAARHRFKNDYRFWDAVKVADAELAIHLATGTVTDSTSQATLVHAYKEAADKVGKSIREFDSVIEQLSLLARFLDCCKDAARAEALRQIASALASGDDPHQTATDSNDGGEPSEK